MSCSTPLRATDYRELLTLMGELGELVAVDRASAVEHLMVRISERLDAASSVVFLDYPQGFAQDAQLLV